MRIIPPRLVQKQQELRRQRAAVFSQGSQPPPATSSSYSGQNLSPVFGTNYGSGQTFANQPFRQEESGGQTFFPPPESPSPQTQMNSQAKVIEGIKQSLTELIAASQKMNNLLDALGKQ